MKLSILKYDNSQKDEICEMLYDYWNELDFGIEYTSGNVKQYINVVNESIKAGKKTIWWVLKNDIKAGFTIFSIENDWPNIFSKKAKISELYIKKNFRRQKIGSFLINNVFNYFHNNNVEKIELEVLLNNEIAIKFWEKKKFKKDKYILKKLLF